MNRKSFIKSLLGISGIGAILGICGISKILDKENEHIFTRIQKEHKNRPFCDILLGKSEFQQIKDLAYNPTFYSNLYVHGKHEIVGISLHKSKKENDFIPFNYKDELYAIN